MQDNHRMLRLGVAMLTCAVASCGGGGGGSATPPPPPPPTPLQVTVDGTSFDFLGLAPYPSGPQNLHFTLSGGDGPYYVDASSDSTDFPVQLDIVSSDTAAVTLQPAVPADQGVRRTGLVTFRVCSDDLCAHVAWSHTYPYDYTQFLIDTTGLTILGSEGVVTGPVTLPVTPADTDGLLAVQTDGSTATSTSGGTWLTADHDADGNLVVNASGVGLLAGSYFGYATVAITPIPGLARTIPVSFTLGTGLVAPALSDIVQQRSSTASSLRGTAPIAFAGGQVATWTAQSDQPWLVIDTPTGTGAGTLGYHIDLATAATAVANWSSGTATVTLSSPGLSDARTTLTLRRQLPEIAMVTPSQVLPGQAATLTVVGRGLSQLSGIDQILVGGHPAAGGTIQSDTQALVQLPAQATASLSVLVTNSSGSPTARANVAVSSGSLAFADILLPTTDSKSSIVYDPSRHAVFASGTDGGTLQRFKLSGGTWVIASTTVGGITRVQMSPDRRTLYALAGDSVVEIDPDTLAVRATHAAPNDIFIHDGSAFGEPLALTSDLRLWMPAGGAYFDIRSGTFRMATPAETGNGTLAFDLVTGTPDGGHLYTMENTYTPRPPAGWYSAATQTTTALPPSVPSLDQWAAFDERGTKGLFSGTEFYRTSDWTLLGRATAPASDSGLFQARVSPDGTRIYQLAISNSTGVVDHVDVYDTTQKQAGTSNFAYLGKIALPASAITCTNQSPCDTVGRLAIDPVGTTLFWVGNHAFVSVPIPSGLSGLSSLASAQAKVRKAATAVAAARAH